MKLTPQWIQTFETNLQTRIVSSWSGYARNTVWDKVMGTKTSSAGVEKFFWFVENATLDDLGEDGGNIVYRDVSVASMEIRNRVSGNALRLSKYEIADNQLANGRGTAMDYAAARAAEWGKLAAYRPQELMVQLLADGTTKKGYDNVAFFSASHPVDPNGGGGTYSNLIASKPIDTTNAATLDVAIQNFNDAVQAVESYTGPNGKPRFGKVTAVLAGKSLSNRLQLITEGKFYGSTGSTENMIAKWGIEPIIMPELSDTTKFADAATSYYLVVAPQDDACGLIFQDREPYELSSYSPQTQLQLGQIQSFDWIFSGRNAGFYGDPFMLAKVKAGA